MKKKRVAAALCAVTLAGAMIAGCGGNDTAGGNDSGDNGNNQEIVLKHMASVQRKSIGTPKLTISWHSGNFKINWRRFIRY